MFVTYDQNGTILATIGGPDLSYGELLDKAGKAWLFLEGATSIDPRRQHVDVAAKAVVDNHAIELAASKTAIAADNADVTVVSGIPKGAAVAVFCNGVPILGEIVDDGEVEFTAAAAGAYRFLVSCATYDAAELEVIAS